MSDARRARALPFLAVLGSVTALGVGTSLAKQQLFPQVGALGTTALRVGFSALLVLLMWRPWQLRHRLQPGDGWAVVRYGVALGFMNLLFYQSLQTIPFGIAVAIEFSGPLAVAMAGSRRWLDLVWLALAITGLALLLPLDTGVDVRALDPAGIAYALGAAACWAAYIVFGKRLSHLQTGHAVSLGLSVAALSVLPFGAAHAGSGLLAPTVLLWGLLVAAVSSAVPISLEMVALKRLPPAAFGILISMEPAVAALLGMLVLHEHLDAPQWLAILCIMSAAAGSSFSARPTGHTARPTPEVAP
jgi:inner membrane transporter RhtA